MKRLLLCTAILVPIVAAGPAAMIFGTDAVSTPDAVSLPTGNDYWFTNGNGTSIPGTQVPSYWVNKVGGEIDYAIQSSGQTLSMSNYTQLWSALNGFVTQSGGPSQTAGKINIGKDATTGLLRAAIAGTDYGIIPSLNGPAGSSTFTEGIISNGVDAGAANIRMVGGNYGAMFQNNGTSFYILLTNSGNAYGLYNGFRPLSVTLATGAMVIDQSGAGVTFGGPVIISDGNPFTSSTSEVPNENWVQGAIGNARTTLFPHSSASFTSAGTITYIVPANVYFMKETVTGGGGGGANCVSSSGNYVSGGGGGAGATAISVVAVTPGQTLTGFVGAGGASLSNGQASSLGGLSAGGGAASSYSNPTTVAGGGGGTASGGQINIPGGSGSDGQQGVLIFAGNGGGSIWGGGGRAGAHAGVAGSAPGSGGGGSYDSTSTGTNYAGGNGAAGAIVLEW